MFSQRKILKSTKDHSAEIDRLKNEIETADAIVIGAGSGLSTAAGFTYSGERFEKYFSDFIEKYQFRDMYSGGFYPFESLEEHWAYCRDTSTSTIIWMLTMAPTRDFSSL